MNYGLVPFPSVQVSTIEEQPTKMTVIGTVFGSLCKKGQGLNYIVGIIEALLEYYEERYITTFHVPSVLWINRVSVSRTVNFTSFKITIFTLGKQGRGEEKLASVF